MFPKSTPNPNKVIATDPDALSASVALGLKRVLDGYQSALLAPAFTTASQRDATTAAAANSAPPPSSTTKPAASTRPSLPVPEVEAAHFDPAAFTRDYVAHNRPCVLRGALEAWPPLRLWTDAYLRSRAAGRRLPVRTRPRDGAHGRMFGELHRIQAYETDEVSLDALLDELDMPSPRYYGARMHLADVLPELLPDTAGGPDSYAAGFGAAKQTNPTCYLGGGRQATPMHFDPAENLLCVVEGAKELTLFHPADAP